MALASLKAEVHLGKKVKVATDKLMEHVRELQVAYQAHIDMRRPGSGFDDDDFDRENRKLLWAKPTNDDFGKNTEGN